MRVSLCYVSTPTSAPGEKRRTLPFISNKAGKAVNSLAWIGLSSFFSDRSLWARATKEKRNKWGYIRVKSFCKVKDTINKSLRNCGHFPFVPPSSHLLSNLRRNPYELH